MMSEYLYIYLLIIMIGVFPNYIWRFFGVLFAARLDEDSPVLQWVNAVATAMIAALVARILILPAGALAQTAISTRFFAMAVGVAIFLLFRRNLGLAIAASLAALLLVEALFL